MASISYNLNVPAATDNPSTSQGQMETNFNSINTIIGRDHVTFPNSGAGYHNRVSFPSAGSQTIPTNALAVFDTKSIGGFLYPYFTTTNGSQTNTYPLITLISPNPSSNPGYLATIGNLLVYFGSASIARNTSIYTLNFGTNFTTSNSISAQGSVSWVSGNGITVTSLSTSSVTYSFSPQPNVSAFPFYWVVIGY